MTIPTRSTKALNVLNKFYRKKVVFIEGKDDVIFWEHILFIAGLSEEIHLTPLGGSEEVDKIITKICDENAQVCAIRDSDYLKFEHQHIKHDRVIYTPGYSIENIICKPKVIAKVISAFTGKRDSLVFLRKYLNEFAIFVQELIRLDFANKLGGCGVKVYGKSCLEIMDDKIQHSFSQSKMLRKTTYLKSLISDEFYIKATKLMGIRRSRNVESIKGHYLISLIPMLIKARISNFGKQVKSISNDSIFAMLILASNEDTLDDDYLQLKNLIDKALNTMT